MVAARARSRRVRLGVIGFMGFWCVGIVSLVNRVDESKIVSSFVFFREFLDKTAEDLTPLDVIAEHVEGGGPW